MFYSETRCQCYALRHLRNNSSRSQIFTVARWPSWCLKFRRNSRRVPPGRTAREESAQITPTCFWFHVPALRTRVCVRARGKGRSPDKPAWKPTARDGPPRGPRGGRRRATGRSAPVRTPWPPWPRRASRGTWLLSTCFPGAASAPGGARRPVAQGPRGLLGRRRGPSQKCLLMLCVCRPAGETEASLLLIGTNPAWKSAGGCKGTSPRCVRGARVASTTSGPPPALWPRSEAAARGARRRCQRRSESLPALHPSLRGCLLLTRGDCSRPRLPGLDCGSRQVSVVQTGCSRTSEPVASQRQEGPRISRRVLRPQPPLQSCPAPPSWPVKVAGVVVPSRPADRPCVSLCPQA